MIRSAWVILALLTAACAAPRPPEIAASEPPTTQAPAPVDAAPPLPEAPAPPAPPPSALGAAALACSERAMQGGAILCRTEPGAVLALGDRNIAVADDQGLAIIGLARDQANLARISVAGSAGLVTTVYVPVDPRNDEFSTLDMECGKIAPQTPEQQRKAEVSWVKKDKALKRFNASLAPFALAKPVDATDQQYSISSFGKTRTYKPKTNDCQPTVNVHNGTDIAVGPGTPIRAPMAGTVLLADPDLYYEGGAVFLDLGRGLVSVTMHMSRIDVRDGQTVRQGDLLGLSGATGRVTGPHVHWGVKYRNPLDPDRGSDIWLDPMLLMKLEPPVAPD